MTKNIFIGLLVILAIYLLILFIIHICETREAIKEVIQLKKENIKLRKDLVDYIDEATRTTKNYNERVFDKFAEEIKYLMVNKISKEGMYLKIEEVVKLYIEED